LAKKQWDYDSEHELVRTMVLKTDKMMETYLVQMLDHTMELSMEMKKDERKVQSSVLKSTAGLLGHVSETKRGNEMGPTISLM